MSNGDSVERDDIDRRIADLISPFGGGAHRHRREQAVAFLLAHADRAYPRLLQEIAAAGGSGPAPALSVLPLFGRAESVPVLRQALLDASDATAPIAAQALAQHPGAPAEDALLAALEHQRPAVVAAAADGLRERAAPGACDALRRQLAHPDADVRLAVLRAASHLDCVTQEELAEIAVRDADETVRREARERVQP